MVNKMVESRRSGFLENGGQDFRKRRSGFGQDEKVRMLCRE